MEESSGDGCLDEPLAPEDPRRKRKAIALTAAVRVLPSGEATPVGALGEDLLFEVLRHIDGRSLARAACVSRLWRRTAEDERLWEIMCTREWRYGLPNLRSMVLAQGGFRRLHSRYIAPFTRGRSSSSSSQTSSSYSPFSSSLVPILPSSTRISPTSPAPSSSSSSHSQIQTSSSNVTPTGPSSTAPRPLRWGRDEVLLSLSLLSSQFYFENMGFKKLMDGGGKEDGSNNGGGSSSGGM